MVRGWEEVAQGGYSQIPGAGVKVSKQPSPMQASRSSMGPLCGDKEPFRGQPGRGAQGQGALFGGVAWSWRLRSLGP